MAAHLPKASGHERGGRRGHSAVVGCGGGVFRHLPIHCLLLFASAAAASPWHQEQGSLMGVRWRFIRCHELCTTSLRFGHQMSSAKYSVQG
ncbi:unnamed protein product [Urochloa humidicola]